MVLHHRDAIERLCRDYGIAKLELFGSAAAGDFDPRRSDVDFLVTFDERVDRRFTAYFALLPGVIH
ncbi:MAG: nucleotidyltransferase domain-containing protein [Planctomycetota bacterium]